jgi:hypothetical protein
MAFEQLDQDSEKPLNPENKLGKDESDIDDVPGTAIDVEKDAAPKSQNTRGEGGALNRMPTAQDWNGADDPENPQNWPFARKAYQTTVVALLAFA